MVLGRRGGRLVWLERRIKQVGERKDRRMKT